MSAKRRLSVPLAWLRRAEYGILARGFLWGMFLPGLGGFVLFLVGAHVSPPLSMVTASPAVPVDSSLSTAELNFLLSPFLRGEATLIVGSSEMASADHSASSGEASAAEALSQCAGGAAVQTVIPAGHAARRTAIVVNRLRGLFDSGRPVRLIVLDNTHYATEAAKSEIDERNYFLDAPEYDLFRSSQSDPQRGLAGAMLFARLRQLEFRSFRAFLGRRGLKPLRTALSDFTRTSNSPASLQDDRPATMPDPGLQRAQKRFLSNLMASAYGRAHIELRDALSANLPPGSRWRVYVLPLNVSYYRRLGFSSAEIAEMVERRRRLLDQVVGVRQTSAPELTSPALYIDSVHFNAAGRQVLAQSLCRVEGFLREFETPGTESR